MTRAGTALLRVMWIVFGSAGIAGVAAGGIIIWLSQSTGAFLTERGSLLIGVLLVVTGLASLLLPIFHPYLAGRKKMYAAALEDLREERDTLLNRVVRLEKHLEHVSVIGEIHVAGNIPDRDERLHALLTAIAEVTGAERVGLYLITAAPEWKAFLRGYYEQVNGSQVYLYVEGENDWWNIGDLVISDVGTDSTANRVLLSTGLVHAGETVARMEVETNNRAARGKTSAERLLYFLQKIRPDDGGLSDIFQSHRPVVDTVASRGRHLLLYPLWAEGQMVGALRLEISHEAVPADKIGDVTDALDASAIHVALALRKEQHRRRAETDGLTGLFIKRYFMERLAELSRSENRKTAGVFSLVMMDIDHFKQVNDTYGHLAGDTVLKGVAGVLRRVLRGGDMAFRYGGEELAVILHGLGLSEAKPVAERLRREIAEADFYGTGGDTLIPITISLGVAEWKRGLSPTDLIARADSALYKSKKNGRNRVTLYNNGRKAAGAPAVKARTARHKAS
ncbi:MAG: GGDEF domain-containing protein [Planctomycetes bacterium]|nr:GGDEF domain-containing protein [Planctomycetota bacterium]